MTSVTITGSNNDTNIIFSSESASISDANAVTSELESSSNTPQVISETDMMNSLFNVADIALIALGDTHKFTRKAWANIPAPPEAVGTWQGKNLNENGVANVPDQIVINTDGTTNYSYQIPNGDWISYYSTSRIVYAEKVGNKIYMIEDLRHDAGGSESWIVGHINEYAGKTVVDYIRAWFIVHILDTTSSPPTINMILVDEGIQASDWDGLRALYYSPSYSNAIVSESEGWAVLKKMSGLYSKVAS